MRGNMVSLTIGAVIVLSGLSARAEKISVGEAPKAVQRAIEKERKGDVFESIDTQKRDGKIIYSVEFKRKGRNRHVQFAENGSVLKGDSEAARRDNKAEQGTAPAASQKSIGSVSEQGRNGNLSLSQVPAPVQKRIKDQVDSGVLKSIKENREDGVTFYTAEFEQKGKKDTELKIAADGHIISDSRIK